MPNSASAMVGTIANARNVRRANVEDVPRLIKFWQQEGLPSEELARRFQEFQVVQHADDGLLGSFPQFNSAPEWPPIAPVARYVEPFSHQNFLAAAENDKATRVYHDENVFGGVTASSYRFG